MLSTLLCPPSLKARTSFPQTRRWLARGAVIGACLFCAGLSGGADSWHHPLCLGGGGFWPLRLPVSVENNSGEDWNGVPAQVPAALLAGASVTSVRVCNQSGVEFLFEVLDRHGVPKRIGRLADDDRLIIPVECPKGKIAQCYLYAGNEQAWAVPDFWRTGLVNGGFEAGQENPEWWVAASTSALHRASYQLSGGRQGGRCAQVEVMPGAPPEWIQWRQGQVPLQPGRGYRFTGWIKTEAVKGRAGWFVHVDGDRPQLVNHVANAGEGTYDWKKVEIRFTAPTNATHWTCGTVLYGTGKAWYDDAAMEEMDEPANTVTVKLGDLQKLTQPPVQPRASVTGDVWPWRVVVRVLNTGTSAGPDSLAMVDLRRFAIQLRQNPASLGLRIRNARTGAAVTGHAWLDKTLLFPVRLPPLSVEEYHLELHPGQKTSEAQAKRDLETLLESSVNLVRNASFESGETLPVWWEKPAGGGENLRFGFSAQAWAGKRCVELLVPAASPSAWVGWRSPKIPLRAGASYLLAGQLKADGLTGSATIHAHLLDQTGKVIADHGYLSTAPAVSGQSGWVTSSRTFQAPADATAAQLHLTMNTSGTLRHDAVLLAEVCQGEALRLERPNAAPPAQDLLFWSVNPLVKVFPDDPPLEAPSALALECAANEQEAAQLALRSRLNVRGVRIVVSPLIGPQGKPLPPARVEKVGFIPIDHPSGYFHFQGPEWRRKLPRQPGRTDGWAGFWPDPLLPAETLDLAENQTQPVWLTVSVPPQSPPGEYRGTVTIAAGGAKPAVLPITVRVLPFSLPEKRGLKAIFDFRFGRGGDFGSGIRTAEERRVWLKFLADRRLGIDRLDPAPKFSYRDGKVSMDTAEFDETAAYCFDDLKMPVAYTPSFFYGFGWAYPPKKYFGLEPFTPEYERAFKEAYQLFSDHVKARGWHDRFVYYISDEPHFKHPHVVEQMKKLCALAHEADPAMPIYSSTWRHCPDWDHSLDIWGVGQYGCFPVREMERLQAAGKKIWFTCDGQMATDTPYLATERMLPYYCHKYGAEGFEFWGVAWWTYNPWERGWHTYIRQSNEGKDYYWIRYPNGDGYLAYPGEPVGLKGPVSTIRLEQVREGLEDYEVLTLLSRLAAQARKAGKPSPAAEKALAAAHDLVSIPNAGGLRSTEILPDPDRLPAMRKAINAAIVDLSKP